MARRPRRVRADRLLADGGFADTPQAAAALILAGKVMVTEDDGRERRLDKAGEALVPGARFRLKGADKPYVSRAGMKLEAALDAFGVDPAGRVALDLGLSTGGFTDCLLARGALRVHGVDVAYGVVAWRLRTDPRLVLHERTNARHLEPSDIGEAVSLVVIDLSFIGLGAIWPRLPPLMTPGGEILALIKPQFELPRGATEGGVVSRADDRARAVASAREEARRAGLHPQDSVDAPIRGRDGNQEVILYLRSE